MVAVLDNKLIKLEIMPGSTEWQEAQKIAQEQGVDAAEVYASQLKGSTDTATDGAQKLAHEQIGNAHGMAQQGISQLPEQHQDAATGLLDGAKNAGTGLVTTLGGTVQGVGNTLGNTVYDVGTGLTNTVAGTGKGLANSVQGKPPAASGGTPTATSSAKPVPNQAGGAAPVKE